MDLEFENLLITTGSTILKNCEEFITVVEKVHFENKQWFINFEDKLNELSIKDHNISQGVSSGS